MSPPFVRHARHQLDQKRWEINQEGWRVGDVYSEKGKGNLMLLQTNTYPTSHQGLKTDNRIWLKISVAFRVFSRLGKVSHNNP